MSREAHVRFCESAGVRFLRATLLIVLGEPHLRQVLTEYAFGYFNRARPHQGIGQRIPVPGERIQHTRAGVTAIPLRGGLHHDYQVAA